MVMFSELATKPSSRSHGESEADGSNLRADRASAFYAWEIQPAVACEDLRRYVRAPSPHE